MYYQIIILVAKYVMHAVHLHRIYCCVTVISLVFAKQIQAKQILGVFPHFGYSHFKVFYPLLRNLAERGHHVTVITYIKSTDTPLNTYEEWLLQGMEAINVVPLSHWTPRTWKNLFNEYVSLHIEGQASCERLYESGFIQRVLQRHLKKSYDILVTEYLNSDCQLVLAQLMDVPIVALSSCLLMPWYYERILLPDTPSYVQSEFIGFSIPLQWHERLTNYLQAKILSTLYRYHTNRLDNALIYRHLNITVDVGNIARKHTRLVFGNQHYSLAGLRSHSEQFIEIGGIHIQEKNINVSLSLEIDEFLSQSAENVLFISWGSMIKASTIDPGKLQIIISVMESLNMRVIWKWETDDWPTKSKSFLFIKWAPQLALLCHPNVKLFWGHGGLLGTTEAVHCGKPIIATPIYGDQFVNAHAIQNRNIGRIIHYDSISESSVKNIIQQMMNTSFANNALEISKIFRDRPMNALDTATWWVEHLLNHKHSSEVLHTHAVELNWFVYYSLDSLAIIAVFMALVIYLLKHLTMLTVNVWQLFWNRATKLKQM